ncbi:HNH endonuclease [Gryllotalpicola koreensis]|uniref:HNH domain-containing protein n=1 Tax=Gryllotalpicola koreensis TaxID=993086 RepID=A0ABP7ZT90_9MICO
MNDYILEAHTASGELWWRTDGLGDERRIAAWLAANKEVGDTFTTEELRRGIGDRLSADARNNAEHFQRRVRELRKAKYGSWLIPSKKHDRTLQQGQYRLERVGWYPALGARPNDPSAVSASTRRAVINRDGRRCVICGIGAGEPYPGRPDTNAVLTVGHVVPGISNGSGDLSNLQTECAECNEPARSNTETPESPGSLITEVANFNVGDLRRLQAWVGQGRRGRDRVDTAFDRYRALSPGGKAEFKTALDGILGLRGRGPG